MSDIDLKEVNEFQGNAFQGLSASCTFVLSGEMGLVFLIIIYSHKDE